MFQLPDDLISYIITKHIHYYKDLINISKINKQSYAIVSELITKQKLSKYITTISKSMSRFKSNNELTYILQFSTDMTPLIIYLTKWKDVLRIQRIIIRTHPTKTYLWGTIDYFIPPDMYEPVISHVDIENCEIMHLKYANVSRTQTANFLTGPFNKHGTHEIFTI